MIPLITRREGPAGNPGDVFIGWGLKHLINKIRPNAPFLLIDKFNDKDFKAYADPIKKAGYMIYAGTPQYNNYTDWCFFYDWDMYSKFIIPWGVNFYPLAGGSGGISHHMTPAQFSKHCMDDKKTRSILKARQRVSKITTVRDIHAFELLKDAGWTDTHLLPCTALWAGYWVGESVNDYGYVALVPPNHYQIGPERLGMTTPDQVGNYVKKIFTGMAAKLREQGYDVKLICHGYKEYQLYKDLAYSVFTNDPVNLMRLYTNCSGVISGRLHGAIPAAGMGKPSVLIGLDTRMSAAGIVGIPALAIDDKELATKAIERLEWHRSFINGPDLCFEPKYLELLQRIV